MTILFYTKGECLTKQILLTQGQIALVDDEDYEWLMQWKWRAAYVEERFYAVRWNLNNKKNTILSMHRAITNAPEGMEVDHRNADGLDNRRENLRVCTHAENVHNSRIPKNNTTGFKGVSPSRGKYRAMIGWKGKQLHIGFFDDAEEAAHAYDEKARELFGEFARLNFPPPT